MKKQLVILIFLCISFAVPLLHAQTTSTTQTQTTPTQPAAQFDMTEFPLWARDLRRAEVIAFGAFPFVYLFSNFGFDTYRFATHGGDTRYAPWPFNSAGTIEKTQSEKLLTLGIAAAGSVIFALVDYAIVRIKRNRLERENNNLPDGSPVIIRTPLDGEETAAPDSGPEQLPEAATP